MKRERVEYESATREILKVQCERCDETWDDRSDDGCNIVALNPYLRLESRPGDARVHLFKDALSRHVVVDYIYIDAEIVLDFCDECVEHISTVNVLHMDVTDEEHYVDESKVTEYLCDFCERVIGEERGDIVAVNPTATIGYDSNPMIGGRGEGTLSLDGTTKMSLVDRHIESYRHDAEEILDYCGNCNAPESSDTGGGPLRSFCVCLKDAMIGRHYLDG